MPKRTSVYDLPLPEENENYSLSIVNEVTQKTEDALVAHDDKFVEVDTTMATKADKEWTANQLSARCALKYTDRKELLAGTDLNNVGVGCHYQATTYIIVTFLNCPFKAGELYLDVYSNWVNGLVQRLTCTAGNGTVVKEFMRSGQNNNWGAWKEIATTETDICTLYFAGENVAGNPTYSLNQWRYVKNGNHVTCFGSIAVSDRGGMTGVLCVKGFPYPVKYGASGYIGGRKDVSKPLAMPMGFENSSPAHIFVIAASGNYLYSENIPSDGTFRMYSIVIEYLTDM